MSEEKDIPTMKRCSNCNAEIPANANYCHHCGQDVRNKVVPFKALAADVVRDTMGFESKFFRSVPRLLFRPGYLTNEFIKGKRASYIPAIRMYIFVSIIAFLIFSMGEDETTPDNLLTSPEQTRALLDTMQMASDTAAFELGMEGIGSADVADTASSDDFDVMLTLNGLQVDNMAAFKKKIDEVGLEVWMEQELPEAPVQRFFLRKLLRMYEDNGWQQLNMNIERNLSIMMFFLIPFFALLMKAFLWRSYYVVHLIFCFHLVSFFFIDMSIFQLLDLYVYEHSSLLGIALFLVYFFIALSKVYSKRWFINVPLWLVLLVLFLAATSIFIMATGILSVALY